MAQTRSQVRNHSIKIKGHEISNNNENEPLRFNILKIKSLRYNLNWPTVFRKNLQFTSNLLNSKMVKKSISVYFVIEESLIINPYTSPTFF